MLIFFWGDEDDDDAVATAEEGTSISSSEGADSNEIDSFVVLPKVNNNWAFQNSNYSPDILETNTIEVGDQEGTKESDINNEPMKGGDIIGPPTERRDIMKTQTEGIREVNQHVINSSKDINASQTEGFLKQMKCPKLDEVKPVRRRSERWQRHLFLKSEYN